MPIQSEPGLSGGTLELRTAGSSAKLVIDSAATPAAGSTFGNALVDFSGTSESLDLAGLGYVSGATATVSGTTLKLTEGAEAPA